MTDHAARLARLEHLAHRMDTAFRIPIIGVRVGYDSIAGLIPGLGDIATLGPALWIVWEAKRLGAPFHVIGRMLANSGTDAVIGAVPILGDLFDAAFKSNRRNVALLRDHLERRGAVQPIQRPQFA